MSLQAVAVETLFRISVLIRPSACMHIVIGLVSLVQVHPAVHLSVGLFT